MHIDWFTVAAQIVNFIILAVLLQRFLYQPILKAMSEREASVAKRFADAKAAAESAEKEHQTWASKAAELEAERQAVLARAQTEAEQKRAAIVQAAEAETQASAERWRTSQESANVEFERVLARRAQQEALGLARSLLPAFSGTDLDARATELFLSQLQALPPDELARLRDGCAAGNLIVRTACAPTEALRTALLSGLALACPGSPAPQFEVDATLLCGVELTAGAWKLRWSLGDYLATLERQVALPQAQQATTHGG